MGDLLACQNCGAELTNDHSSGKCPACSTALEAEHRPKSYGSVNLDPTVAAYIDDSAGGVFETLASAVGGIDRIVLQDADSLTASETVVRPASSETPERNDRTSRFHVYGEIARGGMGAILKGRDADLGRDLAIKVLLEKHQNDPSMIRRFVEEAQINGQLQHPGVVPVYELGAFGDQRPFFAMKLLKGRTLSELLRERKDPKQDQPQFLSIFESICQTIAYAHSRGVIHRDLKPSNVMVGSFGEVQVMDWGLAKVLRKEGAAEESSEHHEFNETVIATARSGSSTSELTIAGGVMGTPAYMSPEQARGEADSVDERVDVFALGALLCQILTGSPPHTGRSSGEAQRKAARGDLSDALERLSTCGADKELIDLCISCLASEIFDRPRNAGLVAESIRNHLSGVQERLRKSELARVEERGRRRLALAAAAAIVLVASLAGGGFVWLDQFSRQRRVSASAALTEARLLADQARALPSDQAHTRWIEALAAAKQAQRIIGEDSSDRLLREAKKIHAQFELELEAVDAEQTLADDLESARGEFAEHWEYKKAEASYERAFKKFGLDLFNIDPKVAAKRLASKTISTEVAAALDDWCSIRRYSKKTDWKQLVEVARAIDPDPWRNQIRDLYGAVGSEALEKIRLLASKTDELSRQPVESLALLAGILGRGQLKDVQTSVLKLAWTRFPEDFWVNYYLGVSSYSDRSRGRYTRPQEAVEHLTAAIAARPKSSSAWSELASALCQTGRSEEGMACHAKAIQLRPDDISTLSSYALDLYYQGKFAESLSSFQKALKLDPNSPHLHYDCGTAQQSLLQLDDAAASYQEALRLDPKFVSAYLNLGSVYYSQNKFADAQRCARKAVELASENVDNLIEAGSLFDYTSNYAESKALYEKAVKLDPKNAKTHLLLAVSLQLQQKFDESLAEYREAARLDPENVEAWANIGQILDAKGDPENAVLELKKARQLLEKQPTKPPGLESVLKQIDSALAKAERRRRPPEKRASTPFRRDRTQERRRTLYTGGTLLLDKTILRGHAILWAVPRQGSFVLTARNAILLLQRCLFGVAGGRRQK